jgi:hypothetical protein
MNQDHASGEYLALLAMQADTPEDVRIHVHSCPECLLNLSIVRSLLAAEGVEPFTESESDHEDDDTRLLAEFTTAMADTAEGRERPDQRAEPAAGHSQSSDGPGGSGPAESGPTYNPLVASVVIVVTAALVIVGVLLWR